MRSDRDITPIVRTWLREGHDVSAAQVLDDVLRLVDANSQRRPLWSPSRVPDLRRLAWVAILVAGALAVMVAGTGLLRQPALVAGSAAPSGPSPATAQPTEPPASLATAGPLPTYPPGMSETRTVQVEGIRLTLFVPTRLAQMSAWEPYGDLLISKSVRGPQGAEAVLFWAGFPDGTDADPCINAPIETFTADDLAAAVSTADGVELVTGPSDVTVGGRPAIFVEVIVRQDAGCDPGFFYNWKAQVGGALWVRSEVGDTIRVWIVAVDGRLLFIGGETHADSGDPIQQEIEQIVASMRFG